MPDLEVSGDEGGWGREHQDNLVRNLCLPVPDLKVSGDEGWGEGDNATEDPDQADGEQDAQPGSLRLQRVHDRLKQFLGSLHLEASRPPPPTFCQVVHSSLLIPDLGGYPRAKQHTVSRLRACIVEYPHSMKHGGGGVGCLL